MLGFVVDEHGRAEGVKDDLVFAWSHALYCWTKSKTILLKDIASIFNVKDEKIDEIEVLKFMKNNSRSNIWQNVDIYELADELEKAENEQNMKINNVDNDRKNVSMSNIYKAFFGV